jgi:hypothetical protein
VGASRRRDAGLHLARKWVAEEWQDWAPRTRQSIVESLARFLPLVCAPDAADPPAGLSGQDPAPDAKPDDGDDAERWLNRWGITLGDLNREQLADVERRLGLADKGQPLAAATTGRYQKNARSCELRAVELGRLPVDSWPPTPRDLSRRKARRKRQAVDVRGLPDPTPWQRSSKRFAATSRAAATTRS